MICYRDMTFCQSDCVNTECVRYLSDEVFDGAEHMMLPLALADFSRDCKEYVPDEDDSD